MRSGGPRFGRSCGRIRGCAGVRHGHGPPPFPDRRRGIRRGSDGPPPPPIRAVRPRRSRGRRRWRCRATTGPRRRSAPPACWSASSWSASSTSAASIASTSAGLGFGVQTRASGPRSPPVTGQALRSSTERFGCEPMSMPERRPARQARRRHRRATAARRARVVVRVQAGQHRRGDDQPDDRLGDHRFERGDDRRHVGVSGWAHTVSVAGSSPVHSSSAMSSKWWCCWRSERAKPRSSTPSSASRVIDDRDLHVDRRPRVRSARRWPSGGPRSRTRRTTTPAVGGAQP